MAVQVTCEYVDQQLSTWNLSKPLVLGVSGPQGSGKLYLANHLLVHLRTKYPHLTSVGLLIDDFYLSNLEQREVTAKAKIDGNTVLQGRGLPGTHDLRLAIQVMEQLCSRNVPVKVPIYDKSAFNGEGDRLPESEWQVIENPVDVIVFEGWFNGYKKIDSQIFPSAYLTQDPSGVVQRHRMYHLEDINERLASYEPLWIKFDFFVYLRTDNLANVFKWRLEQEAGLIAEKGVGMNPDQVRVFVDRYMPMYYLYYERMCDGGVAKRGRNLEIDIDESRKVRRWRRL